MTSRTLVKTFCIFVMLFLVGSQLTMRPANAQGINFPGRGVAKPIEISAERGIEWRQKTSTYIARGNAKAVQGEVAVHGDTLTAYYRKSSKGGTEIWRIDADGKVRIITPTQRAYGSKGVYNVFEKVLTLTGGVRLDTETDRITARDSLEYWEKKSLAIARGNAIAVRGSNKLRADVLTARFEKGKDGKSILRQVDAFNNIIITTPDEVIRSQRGVYDIKTGIVKLTGSVKVTRGEDQLNGARAVVNLNTGVSKIFGDGSRSVQGIFMNQRSPTKSSHHKLKKKRVQ